LDKKKCRRERRTIGEGKENKREKGGNEKIDVRFLFLSMIIP
jgi:hypothetical protein